MNRSLLDNGQSFFLPYCVQPHNAQHVRNNDYVEPCFMTRAGSWGFQTQQIDLQLTSISATLEHTTATWSFRNVGQLSWQSIMNDDIFGLG
jgi:hypothetical protein